MPDAAASSVSRDTGMSLAARLNRPALAIGIAGLALVAGGLTIAAQSDEVPPSKATSHLRMPSKPIDLVPTTTPAQAAASVSSRLYASSPVVVVADAADERAQKLGIRTAATLAAPVLLDDPSTSEEISRLGAKTVLTVGRTRSFDDSRTVNESSAAAEIKRARDAYDIAASAKRDVILMIASAASNTVAVATAENAGATIVELPRGDPRTVPAVAKKLAAMPNAPVIALGAPFTVELGYTVSAVRSGVEQLGGGYLAFPGRTMVALYGHPSSGALGVLGEKGVAATVKRAHQLATTYRDVTKTPIVPAFEIIATVASAGAGKDKNYSAETEIKDLLPLINAAEKSGVYVILDLQPGRTDFLTQAKLYESLLTRANVGLALDPEWRLRPKQKHLTQIGKVSVKEVNRVSDWLATLTRAHKLPQKVFVLHQFNISMITDRGRLNMTHPELATVIHVDGQGGQGAKQGTWKYLHEKAPKGVFWGWKNFHDEDKPMLSVKQTWTKVKPHPELISYQ